ncbi:MAG TPA: hypothetical protein VN920_06890, partial [Pyrinomonadaceae bacterium]|nr:hypothetical protein [Pyrinomonadaceae bacterium]
RVSSLSKAIASTVLSFFAGLGIYEGLSALSILNPPPRYQTLGVMASPRSLPVLSPQPFVKPMPLATMGDMVIPNPIADFRSIPKKVSRPRR